MTQARLADLIHIDLRQVIRYEKGEAQPVLRVAVAIANALQITLDDLARDDGPTRS